MRKTQQQVVIYRSFLPKDKNQVWDLHVKALKETGAFIENAPEDIDADLRNIENIYLQNKGAFIVAIFDKKIIGMGALKKIDNETGEIKRMRLDKKFQGKGVGKAIYKKLEEKSKSLGYKKLILDTTTKQKVARSFYKKYGFKEIKRDFLRDNMDIIFYEKYLWSD